jgi:hypothetical protein
MKEDWSGSSVKESLRQPKAKREAQNILSFTVLRRNQLY